MKRRAVFLDRDGTILNERGYLGDPRKLRFYPGAARALARLQKAGFTLVVISNQSGVARGYFTAADLKRVDRAFTGWLRRRNVLIARCYYCPHLPDAGCSCRKPQPGLIRRAARDLNLDPTRSFVVGDQKRDVQLARNVGGTGILVLTGAGRRVRAEGGGRLAAKVTANLETASRWIVAHAEADAWS